ncbi:hypothetical protein [Streptomyces sp. TM32]|uniref:hypothetical protein n=1 Tax=Streptomyces sp. TM32 TaxID=1652669 RepID=UPI001C20A7CD|nr:hypothetical protein [Streptomyces sp. TM32]
MLDAITAAVHGDEHQVVREDARQVILAARECLAGDDADLYASLHVPAVEALITNLLPTCTKRAIRSPLAIAVVDHARALVDGTHVSQNYPARQRLRVLNHSAHRLLVISQTMPRRRRWRRQRLDPSWHWRTAGSHERSGRHLHPQVPDAAGRFATTRPEAGRPAAINQHAPTA